MSHATDMLDLYHRAERAALSGQSFTMNGRSVTRADLAEIRRGRQEWESKVRAEKARQAGGSHHYSVADFRG